jgi:hypothetical protein
MKKEIPILICVDVEPREREIDSTCHKDWEGFEEVCKFLNGIRARLEKATQAPASFSWFLRMDPQIEHTYGVSWWVAQRYREIIAQLELAGDEIGLHTHAWRWNESANRWVIDHADQQWIEHCVRRSFEAYRAALGRPCLSFRFGDRWMNNETIDLLEKLGVKFDLTLEPGMKEKPALVLEELHTGSLPDYTYAPTRPYKPSKRDFRKESRTRKRGLWMMPLSTERKIDGFARVKRTALALGVDLDRRHETIQLNLGLDGPAFRELMNGLVNVRRASYLAPVMRTDVGADPRLRGNVEENMECLLSHPLARRFRFVRPADAIELLT